MKSKIKPNYSKHILCFLLLNALCILVANCNSSKTSKKANNTPKSTDIEASRFNSEKFVDHDKAFALWLLKQDFALTVMSQDDKGKIRIPIYNTYLK